MNNIRLIILVIVTIFMCVSQTSAFTWDELLKDAKVIKKSGDFDSALVLIEQALNVAIETNGEIDSSVALILHRTGTFWHSKDRTKAKDYYIRALSIWENLPIPNYASQSKTLNNLAVLYSNMLRYSEALKYINLALKIKESIIPKPLASIAKSLKNIADIYFSNGNFYKAVEFDLQAIEIKQHLYGINHKDVLDTKRDLADTYMKIAKFEEAEELYQNNIKIADSLSYLKERMGSRINYAAALLAQYKLNKSELACLEALRIYDSSKFNDEKFKALILKNLGIVYTYSNRYDKAKEVLDQEILIVEKRYKKEDPEYLRTQFNLANYYLRTKKYNLADSLHSEVLITKLKLYNNNHPDLAYSYFAVAEVLFCKNEYIQSLEYAHKSFQIQATNFDREAFALSESDCLRYASNMKRAAMLMLSSALNIEEINETELKQIASVLLSVKGPVSDEIFQRHQAIIYDTSDELIELSNEYKYLRNELARQHIIASSLQNSSMLQSYIDSLSITSELVEQELSRRLNTFRSHKTKTMVDLAKIISEIPPNACLIDFIKADLKVVDSVENNEKYIAVILNSENLVKIIVIGDVKNIDNTIKQYRDHFSKIEQLSHWPSQQDNLEYKTIANKLFNKIWEPLLPYIKKKALVIIAPDGALNNISFAGLVDGQNNYSAENIAIHYLNAGRDVIRIKEQLLSNIKSLLAIGNPDFDLSIVPDIYASNKSQIKPLLSYPDNLNITRGSSNCFNLNIHFTPLPGTIKEIELITKKWYETYNYRPKILVRKNATEKEFKISAHSYDVIHFATHSFFINDTCSYKQLLDNDPRYIPIKLDNPLLYSGLVLAGANNFENSEGDSNEGILTAEEIATLNLHRTKLVVLSSCNSGLGRIQNGEGIYGLRKAFHIAGAKTIVNSLWAVPDANTIELMRVIYNDFKVPIWKRMHDGQLKQLENLRKNNIADHPYLWAGFIATGAID